LILSKLVATMAAHFTGEENMEKIMPVKRLGYYEGNG
jgi:hypothetical protein